MSWRAKACASSPTSKRCGSASLEPAGNPADGQPPPPGDHRRPGVAGESLPAQAHGGRGHRRGGSRPRLDRGQREDQTLLIWLLIPWACIYIDLLTHQLDTRIFVIHHFLHGENRLKKILGGTYEPWDEGDYEHFAREARKMKVTRTRSLFLRSVRRALGPQCFPFRKRSDRRNHSSPSLCCRSPSPGDLPRRRAEAPGWSPDSRSADCWRWPPSSAEPANLPRPGPRLCELED